MYRQDLLIALTLLTPVLGICSSPEIGAATARGRFTVDHNTVVGSATIFDGTLIETARASSTVRLAAGARVDLASFSQGTAYKDRFVLGHGSARVEYGSGLRLEARNFFLSPSSKDAAAIVLLAPNSVQVSVERGLVDVSTKGGNLLAHMTSGGTMSYAEDTAGQDNPSKSQPEGYVQLTGTLQKIGDHYLLKDRASQITYELIGHVPASQVGATVTVTGNIVKDRKPVEGAEKVAEIDTSKKAPGGFPCFGGGGGRSPNRIQLTGPLQDVNDHYLLTDTTSHVTSELIGSVHKSDVGKTITIEGKLVTDKVPYTGAEQIIDVGRSKVGAGAPIPPCKEAVIYGVLLTGAAVGIGIALDKDPTHPISQ
jgi:hypothetical protein